MGKHLYDEKEEDKGEEKTDDKEEARPYSKNLQGQFFRTSCNCGPLHARCQHNQRVQFKSVFASSIQEKRLLRNDDDDAPPPSFPTPTPKRPRIDNNNNCKWDLEKVAQVPESQTERHKKLVFVDMIKKENPVTTNEDASDQHIGKCEKFDEHDTRKEEAFNDHNNSSDKCIIQNVKLEHCEYEPPVEKLIKREVNIEEESLAAGYQIWEDDNEDENPLNFPDFEIEQIQGEEEICQVNWNFIDDILNGMTVDDMIELNYILS